MIFYLQLFISNKRKYKATLNFQKSAMKYLKNTQWITSKTRNE